MYKIKNDLQTNLLATIIKINENGSVTSFGVNPANTDYQAYLKWVSEGNEPLPAEVVVQA